MDEISGGISNLLWKLTPKLESGLAPIVARIFGEQPDTMSREREEDIVLQMNQHGFGAPVSHQLLSNLFNQAYDLPLSQCQLVPVRTRVVPVGLQSMLDPCHAHLEAMKVPVEPA